MSDIVWSKLGDLEIEPQNDQKIIASSTEEGLTVNNVAYKVTAIYHKWGGKWQVGAEVKSSFERRYDLRIQRYEPLKGKEDATENARQKIQEELDKVVNTWAKENPNALLDALIAETKKAVESIEEEIVKADKVLEDLRRERNNTLGKLCALRQKREKS